LIRDQLKHGDDSTWGRLISDSGPLSTFAAKVAVGHAMGLYDDDIRKNLNIVKDIRNAFAHPKRLLTFEEPEITHSLQSIILSSHKHSRQYKNLKIVISLAKRGHAHNSFLKLCLSLEVELLLKHKRKLAASNRNLRRSVQEMFLKLLPEHQSDDPTTLTQPPTVETASGEGDNKDK
jgi:hypothetical protein